MWKLIPAVSALVSVSAITVLAGCSHASSQQPSSPGLSSPPSGSPTATAPPTASPHLSVPPVSSGEISREVFSHQAGSTKNSDTESTISHAARTGQTYWIRLACAASAADFTMNYTVTGAEPGASSAVLVSGEIACDSTVTENELSDFPAQLLTIHLSPGATMPSTVSAYAILATS